MKIGDHVAWKWGNGLAEGIVTEIRPKRTELMTRGAQVVRNGTETNPAVIIQQASGTKVLKLASELQITTI